MKIDTIIFDGSNAAHRISAACTPLTNAKGERVEVIFGLLRLISAQMRNNQAYRCYVVWDGIGSKKLRQDLDPEYKLHRDKERDDEAKERIKGMHKQVDRFWDLFARHLPIYWLISDKYEADDIMAMLAHQQELSGRTSLIVTGDKDLLQLVNKNITVYSPSVDDYCTPENFEQYSKGFPDGKAYLAAKCLMGDSSDNVRGVGGVGEKTAIKILSAHGWDLTSLLLNPSDELIKSKVGQAIISPSGKARIALNYKLMSLHGKTHYKLNADKVEQRKGRMSSKELRTNLARMQFASLMASFNQFIAPFQYLEG